MKKGEEQNVLLASAVSQRPLVQNNLDAKVAYLPPFRALGTKGSLSQVPLRSQGKKQLSSVEWRHHIRTKLKESQEYLNIKTWT